MNTNSRWTPLLLTAAVIIADQVTKFIVVSYLPFGRPVEVLGDFLRLTYVHNPAIAFSIGRNLPISVELKRIIVSILPVLVIAGISYYYVASTEISRAQRWLLAAMLGGGIGNFIDRIVRPDGVVDFVDVEFFNIFGLQRWPTFNVADSSVVVAGFLLLLTFLRAEFFERNKDAAHSREEEA